MRFEESVMSNRDARLLQEDLRRLFAELEKLGREVTELRTTIKLTNPDKRIGSLETRLKTLEAVAERRVGAYAVIGFLSGAIGAVILSVIGWWVAK
jgi:chromosome segregation ATPase